MLNTAQHHQKTPSISRVFGEYDVHEKEIFQLKQAHQEFTREILDINKRISEISVVNQDVKSKAAIISYLDEFKNKQIAKNQELSKKDDDLQSDLNAVSNYIYKTSLSTSSLKEELINFKEEFYKLKSENEELKKSIHSSTHDLQIKQLRDSIFQHYVELKSLIVKIEEEFSKPLSDIKNTHLTVLKSSDSATELSKESQKVSERVGVEVRVLNWKLNEILHRLGHKGF